MSKLLTVHLVDGRILEIPIDQLVEQLIKAGKLVPGAPVDHPEYGNLLFNVCTRGMSDPQAQDSKRITFIPPSQIKSATLDIDYKPVMTIDNGSQQ